MKRKNLTKTIMMTFRLHGLYKNMSAFKLLQRGIDFSRQILTTKVYPRTVRVNILLEVADPWHRYSNES